MVELRDDDRPDKHGYVVDEDRAAGALSTDLEFLAKYSMNALARWVDGAQVFWRDYHDWEVPEPQE